jgi:hypothetical protein
MIDNASEVIGQSAELACVYEGNEQALLEHLIAVLMASAIVSNRTPHEIAAKLCQPVSADDWIVARAAIERRMDERGL